MISPSSSAGADAQVSPLHGVMTGLGPHLVLVAGRDCLRDEGMLYAKKLEDNDVVVKLYVYAGMPQLCTLRRVGRDSSVLAGFEIRPSAMDYSMMLASV